MPELGCFRRDGFLCPNLHFGGTKFPQILVLPPTNPAPIAEANKTRKPLEFSIPTWTQGKYLLLSPTGNV